MDFFDVKKLADEGKTAEAYALQCRLLDAKLDPRNVADRSQAGQTLSYLESHVVIQMLNKVFGYGNWSLDISNMNKVMEDVYEKNGKEMSRVGYTCQATLRVRFINGQEGYYTDNGYGSGVSNNNSGAGPQHESAQKEAVSDAQKRAARHVGFALQLYDKEKRRVGFDEYTILLQPISASEVRGEAGKNAGRMEYVKGWLVENGIEGGLAGLSSEQMESLFRELVKLP